MRVFASRTCEARHRAARRCTSTNALLKQLGERGFVAGKTALALAILAAQASIDVVADLEALPAISACAVCIGGTGRHADGSALGLEALCAVGTSACARTSGTGSASGCARGGLTAELDADIAALRGGAVQARCTGLLVSTRIAKGSSARLLAEFVSADLAGGTIGIDTAGTDQVFGNAHTPRSGGLTIKSCRTKQIGCTRLEAARITAQVKALVGSYALSVAAGFASVGIKGDGLGFACTALARLARAAVGVGGTGDRRAASRGVDTLLLTAAHVRTTVSCRTTLVFVASLCTTVSIGRTDADIGSTAAICGFRARFAKARCSGNLAWFTGFGGRVAGKTTAAIGLLGAV